MKVHVDYGLCESNGVCEGHAPDIFDLRDDDLLYLKREDVPAHMEAEARAAEVGCPRQAIRLIP